MSMTALTEYATTGLTPIICSRSEHIPKPPNILLTEQWAGVTPQIVTKQRIFSPGMLNLHISIEPT